MAKMNSKKNVELIDNPWTYVVVSIIGFFGFYNFSGFSLYHWIANFTKRIHELGGTFPNAMYSNISIGVTVLLLLFSVFRGIRNKDIPIFFLGASALGVFVTVLLCSGPLNLNILMVIEAFLITILFIVLLGAFGTVIIRSVQNYMTLNSGFQAIPLFFIALAIFFWWFWSLKWDLSVAVIGTSLQIALIPPIAIGYRLAKFTRRSSGTISGTTAINDFHDGAAQELADSIHDHETE